MNAAILMSIALVATPLIHGTDCLPSETSPRNGGVIVETLGEVAIIQELVTVHLNISSLKKLPTHLDHLKKVLNSTQSKNIVDTTNPSSLNQVLNLTLEMADHVLDSMMLQLSSVSHNLDSSIKDDQGTNKFTRGRYVNQKKVIHFHHQDLQKYVTRTIDTTKAIEKFPIPGIRTSLDSSFSLDNILIIITLLEEWIVRTDAFFNNFLLGLKAAKEGMLIPFILPTKDLSLLYIQALSHWNLRPIEYKGETYLYYNLAECYLLDDEVIIKLPFQGRQSFTLSRLQRFPIAFQDALLMIKIEHNLILTTNDFMYAYPSVVDLYHYCKMPFLNRDFLICLPFPMENYPYQISTSCESDVYFGFHSVSSCTYFQLEEFSQPISFHLGSHFYLHFPKVEEVRITCPSQQPAHYVVQGPYALDDRCSMRQIFNLFFILLPGIQTPENLDQNQILKNITNLVAFPSNWDTSKLTIVTRESSSSNLYLAQIITVFIVTVSLIKWLCTRWL